MRDSPSDLLVDEAQLRQLLTLALRGDRPAVERFVRRLARERADGSPHALARIAFEALRGADSISSPFRSETQAAVPVDLESRVSLLRPEYPVTLESEPIWSDKQRYVMQQIVEERRRISSLHDAGLSATRSCLFIGPPGCGKTLATRWLARELDIPLLTLDLSSVISSFLGRTGANIRNVLDYAKGFPCVMLLDEIDAIAKRRGDEVEIGELKRLVAVLLQEVDLWPERSLLVGATNHPELLDRAVWRRFDLIAEFPRPTLSQTREMLMTATHADPSVQSLIDVAAEVMLVNGSFSEVHRDVLRARRDAIISLQPFSATLRAVLRSRVDALPRDARHAIARRLLAVKRSQREISDLTGVSRDTLRNFLAEGLPE